MSSTQEETTAIREQFTRLLRWAGGSLALALVLAGCGGGGEPVATTTAQAAPADVVGLAAAQQSASERIAVPRLVAMAAVAPGTATENFEAGMADWANWGNAQVVAGAGTSGSSALQVGTGAGGAGLMVSGITPGQNYRLTAQVRVSDPSERVGIGINFFDAAGNFLIGRNSPLVSNTGYATVTIDQVAPSNASAAVVWIWKNAGSGYAYLDDVVFGPVEAPPPPSTPPADNLLTNGGFESGMTGWVDWGNSTVVSGQASSGSSALRVGTAAGGAGQDVGGIVPGTIYRLVAQAKVSDPSETVFVGVRFTDQYGNPQMQSSALSASSTSYGTVSFDTTAPPNAVKATVFVWKNAGSGFGYVDDVSFGVAPGSAPPPPPPPPPVGNLVANGGFENGLANWVDWGNSTASTGQAAAGTFAAQVGTGAGGFGQDVGGVVGGKTYRLTALAKVSTAGETGYLGVRFTDDAGARLLEQSVQFTSTTYSRPQLSVAAPANATRALVYVWKNAGSGFAYVDQVELAQAVERVALTSTSEQVNPVESGRRYGSPGIARLTTGGYVIVWNASPPSSGIGFYDTCFHRYEANGASSAPAACVAGAHAASSFPLVVARPEGGFTIRWNEASSSSDPAGYRWQDYDASGTPQGPIQSGPLPIRLTAQPLVGGGYVKLVSTQAAPVAFQLYAADGTPIGQPQPVSDRPGTPGVVVGLTGGGFAVAWMERDATGALLGMTRTYSADGTPRAEAVAIAPNTLGPIGCTQFGPPCPPWQSVNSIAATPDGGYIVTWIDGTGIASTGGGFARQFRADGSPASNVVGKLGDGVGGPLVAVGADSFVMVTEQLDALGNSGAGINALHVNDVPLR